MLYVANNLKHVIITLKGMGNTLFSKDKCSVRISKFLGVLVNVRMN